MSTSNGTVLIPELIYRENRRNRYEAIIKQIGFCIVVLAVFAVLIQYTVSILLGQNVLFDWLEPVPEEDQQLFVGVFFSLLAGIAVFIIRANFGLKFWSTIGLGIVTTLFISDIRYYN